jgi:hypothetical protein
MKNKSGFILIPVETNKEHIEILYHLLKNRVYNISHQKLPDYNSHKSFVYNHPYRKWFLVKNNDEYIGSIYILDNNCIGVNIDTHDMDVIKKSINWILMEVRPLEGIKSLRNEHFHININPRNKEMIGLVNSMNATLIEQTYIIKK